MSSSSPIARDLAIRVHNGGSYSIHGDGDVTGRPMEGYRPIAEVLAARQGITLMPDRRQFAALDRPVRVGWGVHPAVANFVFLHARGLIRYGVRVDVVDLIGEVCAAFPRATIAIMLPSRKTIAELRARLSRMGIRVNERIPNVFGDEVCRVFIGTPTDSVDDAVEFQKRDLTIFAFAETALHELARSALIHPDHRFRTFGFLREDTELSRTERFFLPGAFGVDDIIIPARGHQQARVFFRFARFNSRIRSSASSNRCVQDYWRDASRNIWTARIARAFASGQLPLQSGESTRWDGRVLVVVQSVSHAVELSKFLNSWPLVVGDDADTEGLPSRAINRILTEPFWFHPPQCAVVTVSGLEKYCRYSAPARQVLILACDGPYIPSELRPLLITPTGTIDSAPPYAVLVDVADRSNPERRRFARRRERAYRELGFVDHDCESLTRGRALNFLHLSGEPAR